MILAELITALEAADPDHVVRHGFTNPHSYRGYYDELAFEPASNVTVADMLDDARNALGATYEGWKGGDFTMRGHTDCWLSEEGSASGDTISALLLQLMLTSATAEDLLPVWEAVYEPGNVSDYLIGYANSEAGAKGAAEAWMRSQKDEVGRLEWMPQNPLDGYDEEFELLERHEDGVDTGPGIAVRRRTTRPAAAAGSAGGGR